MTDTFERLKAALADHYTIERELGAGGMATVYLAHDVKHDRKVAVKVLRSDLSSELGADRFLREIKLAARLTHPHILPLFDSGEASGFLYYVMPVVEGESLRDRIKRERQLTIEETVKVATEVAAALDYAHRHAVVHRDIKPENILIHDGNAVVADFGIGKAVTAAATGTDTLTQAGVTVGTPAYMSPEQASGEDEIDGRSDLYSLGCVLYEMLTGEQPFTGATAQAVIAKRFAITPPPVTATREAVPTPLSGVISKLLERTPADRFATGSQLIDTLRSGETALPAKQGAAEKSIAVLPFANMSADPENEFFADGITDEIINLLSKFQDLHVVARTSCFAFKGKNEDLRVIGDKLSVTKVLEGSVRKAGNRVRITTQLVNVADGYQLWSERYDRELDDIFEMQDEIAVAIADQLKVALGDQHSDGLVKPGTADLDAYQLYLKGRFYWNQRGAGLTKALEFFQDALKLDPAYALAHAGVSDTLSLIGLYGMKRPHDVLPQARRSAEEALKNDDSLAECHAALGWVKLMYDWDFWGSKESQGRALALNPRYVAASYWRGAAGALTGTSTPEEAIADCERAVSIDPLAFHPRTVLSWALIFDRRFAVAIPHLKQIVELQTTWLGHWLLGVAYRGVGQLDEAVGSGEAAVELSSRHPWSLVDLGITYLAVGREAEALAFYEELEERAASTYVQHSQRAILAAHLGRIDEAFALLATAVDERDGFLVFLKKWPPMDPLRGDARYDAILREIGFPS